MSGSSGPTATPYVRVSDIAQGGMGYVELVVKREGRFQRFYARKRLHARYREDPLFRTMFMDEARLAGLVRHRNVVSVLDVGSDDEGPYLIMEFVEGQPASRVLARVNQRGEKLPVDLGVRIAIEAAHGLHAAHEARGSDGQPLRLVHRDVSPQNILVGYDGGVRVTDFGIAKALGNDARTSTGVLKGNMGYLSPEQLRFEEPDRRSDLFSLGVTLFELLTGTRLYANREGFDGTRRILNEPAPDVRDLRAEVPAEIAALLLSMMAKERDQRPTTAHEVAGRLEAAAQALGPGGVDVGEFMSRHFAVERAAIARLLERGEEATPSDEPAPREAPEAATVASGPGTRRRRVRVRVQRWIVAAALVGAAAIAAVVVRVARAPSLPPVAGPRVWAGGWHTCATGGGALHCWGRNSDGQLGLASDVDTTVPRRLAQIGEMGDVHSVGLGWGFTCVCTRTGKAFCWGVNNEGQLGAPGAGQRSDRPVAVDGIDDCAEISAGPNHVCAARRDGTVACWGRNSSGQVGTAGGPLIVAAAGVPRLGGVVEIDAGGEYSCARRTNGEVSCWGRNKYGELGEPSPPRRIDPKPVPGVTNAVEVALGRRFGCARTSAGRVICWGALPPDSGETRPSAATAVPGIDDAVEIAAGRAHVCVIRRSGAVACWGSNELGQLGDGTTRASPTPVAVAPEVAGFVSLAAGDAYTCGRHAKGIVCWGANDAGQLGDGGKTAHLKPAAVVGL